MFQENGGADQQEALTFAVSAILLVASCSIVISVYCCFRRRDYEKVMKTAVIIYSLLPEKQSEWISHLINDNFLVKHENPQRTTFKSFRISSSSGNKCILYHSKMSGRINLIDGTDPLYDKLFPKIYSKFGKENIAVVVDHLDDIEEMKRRIERSQKSVYEYAKYMFYFKNGCELEECSDTKQSEEIKKLKQFLTGTDQPHADTLNPDSLSQR